MGEASVEHVLRRRYAQARARLATPAPQLAPPPPPACPARPVTCDAIIAHVCAFYGISALELCSSQRSATILRARWVVIHLARTLTVRSLPAIGARIHRSHTAVYHAVRRIAEALARDAGLVREVAELARRVTSGEAPSGPPRRKPTCCPLCGQPRMNGEPGTGA